MVLLDDLLVLDDLMLHDDLVVLLESLRAIVLVVNGSKFELFILNDSMPKAMEACSEGSFRGLGWLKRVAFHCWEPWWI